MKTFAISITLGFLLYTRLVTAQTNLIFNGGFDTSAAGWATVGIPSEGDKAIWGTGGNPGGCLELTGLNTGGTHQYLNGLVPGSKYLVSWSSMSPLSPLGTELGVGVDYSGMNIDASTNQSWEYFGFVFTAQSLTSQHFIGFGNRGPAYYLIDNVSIQPIPETPGPALQIFSTQNWIALSVSGPSGQYVVLEASTNLVSWQPFATNAMPFFYSHIPKNPINTFYRASKPL